MLACVSGRRSSIRIEGDASLAHGEQGRRLQLEMFLLPMTSR
jgi:hypothetical protein